MKYGHSRNLFYAFRSRFSFNLHTSVTQQNKSNTRWDFIFIGHLKTTCGWRRRPAGRQRWRRCPAAAGGRRPGQRGVPTLAAAADRERWTSAAARLVRCVNSRTVLWLYWAVSHHRMCRYGSRVISLCTIWLFMWSSSCTCFEYTLVAYKHTYFVQRNRMKCGHSRNLFYVSRSCFSFYFHTFVTHRNNWNTRWDFIFIRHLKTTCGI